MGIGDSIHLQINQEDSCPLGFQRGQRLSHYLLQHGCQIQIGRDPLRGGCQFL